MRAWLSKQRISLVNSLRSVDIDYNHHLNKLLNLSCFSTRVMKKIDLFHMSYHANSDCKKVRKCIINDKVMNPIWTKKHVCDSLYIKRQFCLEWMLTFYCCLNLNLNFFETFNSKSDIFIFYFHLTCLMLHLL